MSVATESLIRSIQCLDELSFYGWFHALKGTPALDAPIGEGITALAVASRLYSLSVLREPRQAERYARMAALLIEAGAAPSVRIGEKKASLYSLVRQPCAKGAVGRQSRCVVGRSL